MDPPVANNNKHTAMKPSSHHINNPSGTDDHDKYTNLRNDYSNAVSCLVQCETLISSLESQLVTKDKQIATLEKKLVDMSLELASSKSMEDVYRSKRRVSTGDNDSMSVDGYESIASLDFHPSYATRGSGTSKRGQRQQQRRNSNGSSSSSYKPFWGSQSDPILLTDDSLKSSLKSSTTSADSASMLNDTDGPPPSSTRRRGSLDKSFERFFRRNFTTSKLDSFEEDGVENEGDDMMGMPYQKDSQRTFHCPTGERRPASESRMRNRVLKDSATSISSALVFPKSAEDVVTKGCTNRRTLAEGSRSSSYRY